MNLVISTLKYCMTPGVCISRLPDYACKFLEMCLMVTADHGPAVSGAHNTIVTARAGKDLVSCLTSGLLTIVRMGYISTPVAIGYTCLISRVSTLKMKST